MIKSLALAPLAALALSALPAYAAPKPLASGGEASIPFVSHGGVDDWRADGDRVIYFRDIHRQWYRATLMTRAVDLPFTEHIGIEARGTDRLDKFASVIVHGQSYPIESLIKVEGPPVKGKKAHPHDRHIKPNA